MLGEERKLVIKQCYLMHLLIDFLVICILLFVSCAKKDQEYLHITDFFTKVDSLIINPSLGISEIMDFKRLDDTTFVLTDFFARSLYLLNKNSMSIEQIGRIGQGPGEYSWPAKIQISKDGHIWYSDINRSYITEIDRKGKYLHKIDARTVILNFCMNQSGDFYFLSPLDYMISVCDKSGQLKKRMFKISDQLEFIMAAIRGGGICCDDEGNLYFANVADYKVTKCNSNLNVIKKFGRTDASYYKALSKKVLNNPELPRKQKEELLNDFTSLSGLFFLKSGLGYVLVRLRNRDNTYLDIWDKNGNFVASLYLADEYPIGVSKDELFTIKGIKNNVAEETTRILNIYQTK